MTDFRKKHKRRPHPVKLVMVGNNRKTSFDFGTPESTQDAWMYVLELTMGQNAWLPMRVGKNLHVIAVDHVQWGTA
jgi:hypothetical protein